MTQQKRRRHPRVPEFPPLERLVPGSPFNPNALYEGYSVRQAIGKFPKLSAAAKFVYVILADQVYTADYDWHTELNLAGLCGLSRRQFQRHLRALKKAHLVKVATNLGRSNYIWLLYHPAFALCSPLTPVISDVGGTTEASQGVRHIRRTQRNIQRNYQRSSGVTRLNATSSSVPLPSDGRRESEAPTPGKPWPATSENGEIVNQHSPPPALDDYPQAPHAGPSESLCLKPDARSFWYSFSPIEKRNRLERASSVHERVIYFRQFLQDPHAEIQRQARLEIQRGLAELGSMGFTLHSNGKGKT